LCGLPGIDKLSCLPLLKRSPQRKPDMVDEKIEVAAGC